MDIGSDPKITARRCIVADSFARGDTPAQTLEKVRADPRFADVKISTIHQDRSLAKATFQEMMAEDPSMKNALDEYMRRNRNLRDIALKEHQVGKECPECHTIVRFTDPRALKIAVDLDKDLAKAEGVYQESVTIKTEDAAGFVTSVLDMIDRLAPDAKTRSSMLDAMKALALENNVGV